MGTFRKYLQIILVFAVITLAVQVAIHSFPGWTVSIIIGILLTINASRWMDGSL